jgi:hypothetical protein
MAFLTMEVLEREPGASSGHRDHESPASKADLRAGRSLRVDVRGRACVRITFARRGRALCGVTCPAEPSRS